MRRITSPPDAVHKCVQQFKADVESGGYPSDAESYHLPRTKAELEAILRRKEMKAYSR